MRVQKRGPSSHIEEQRIGQAMRRPSLSANAWVIGIGRRNQGTWQIPPNANRQLTRLAQIMQEEKKIERKKKSQIVVRIENHLPMIMNPEERIR